ncbi:MAG: hypothetical protein HYY49_11575 [Ignavibacteriales bacterium]|nr:hypothetical protein [Ignavibacteriales bacterium]
MESFLQVVQMVALISASALCVYLIITLVKLNDLFGMLQKDLGEISRNAKPVFENLNVITEKLKSISTKVDEQANMFRDSMESFRMLAENVLEFERRIEQRVEEPIIRVTSILGGLVDRFTSLFRRPQTPQ